MILLGNVLRAVAGVLDTVIFIFYILLIARVILSWVSPDPRNPIVQFIYNTTEPVLSKVRAKIPPFGMLDLSPIVVFLVLYAINIILVDSMHRYGMMFLQSAPTVVGGM